MTAEAAMILLLLERGVCTDVGGAFMHQGEKVQTLRCTYQPPPQLGSNPYRVPGADRG